MRPIKGSFSIFN